MPPGAEVHRATGLPGPMEESHVPGVYAPENQGKRRIVLDGLSGDTEQI